MAQLRTTAIIRNHLDNQSRPQLLFFTGGVAGVEPPLRGVAQARRAEARGETSPHLRATLKRCERSPHHAYPYTRGYFPPQSLEQQLYRKLPELELMLIELLVDLPMLQ